MYLSGASWEEVRRTFRWEIPARFNIAAAVCDRHAAARPTATALIFERADADIDTWSFRRLQQATNRLANALRAIGVGRGDVVAIHLPQCPESPVSHIAVQKLGAIALPMFNLFGPDAIAYRLTDSGARVLVTTREGYERVRDAVRAIPTLRHVVVTGADPQGRSPATPQGLARFDAILENASDQCDTADTGPDDPAILMYTSGTTGNPKGVLHAGRVVIGHLPGVIVPHEFFPQAGDRMWTPADWAWAGGLLDVLLPSLFCGVPVVGSARAKFDPEWAFAFMARHGMRNVFMPPTALRLMRQVEAPRERHAYDLRTLGTGGETLGTDMIAWGRETFGLTINEFYGQTEVNLVVANSVRLFPVRPGSMGRAVPGHDVEVVDHQGNLLPPGTPGIVAVRRPDPVMFLEYWRRPEATAEKFRGDWCLLGDIAEKDADGYFWFKGRDDDIINSAGYRIGPGEVEECLMKHPAVALSGVVGLPDAVRGEIVAAFVVTKPGVETGPELAADIQAFVRERLAAHEYPRRIDFVAELPMTVTGKVRRVDLRALGTRS
jgi:acetyl-CoA synthetase